MIDIRGHEFSAGDSCEICGCSRKDAEMREWECLMSRDDPREAELAEALALENFAQAVRRLETESELSTLDTVSSHSLLAVKEALDQHTGDWSDAAERRWRECVQEAATASAKFLDSTELPVSMEAMVLLQALGATVTGALGPLLRLAVHDNPYVRQEAFRTLAEIAPHDKRAIDTALRGAADKEELPRAAAIKVLGRSGVPAAPAAEKACLAALNDRCAQVRVAATEAVVEMAVYTEPCESRLRDMLTDKSKYVRRAAEAALAQFESEDGKVGDPVSRCIELLRSPKAVLRSSACDELAELGPAAKAALDGLFELFGDIKPSVRDSAARALAAVGGGVEEARVRLLAMLESSTGPVHVAALEATAMSTYRRSELTPALLAIVRDANHASRSTAVQIIAEIEGDRRVFIPHLLELVETSDPDLRAEVHRTLFALPLDPEAALSLARRGLADPASEVRFATVAALEKKGRIASAVFPELLRIMTTDKDHAVCFRSGRALNAAGPGPPESIPDLIVALKHREDLVSESAAEALGQMGKVAASAAPALVRLARRDRPEAHKALISIMGFEFWQEKERSR
jgi:HEAT repeat protein